MKTEKLANIRGVKYEAKDSRRNMKGGDNKNLTVDSDGEVVNMYICICVIPNPKFIIRIKTNARCVSYVN